ncbi:hypothetical protein Sjap_011800 [Stephania japonica]|uniref:SAM-dependent MTase RsmB/NOP-type domain-containing protein n=1 Tax=Stephania japonica TaxID=461633 RepID=A0AAP0JE41_9MAGN
MARRSENTRQKRKPASDHDQGRRRRQSNTERSAYFARREAAKVLRCVLQGDARRRAVASIKTLVYGPSVRNKKATFALRNEELVYIIMYDILFGQAITLAGDAEKFLLLRKDALQVALAQLCVRKKVRKDDMVPNLLVLPPGTDLHAHPLVNDGRIFLQGRASSMVAVALSPEPGWEVLDACSAPGNKTVHLAALMSGKGKIIACELNKDRVKLLEETIRRSGASSILLIRAILLDPSCSGSGTAAERLDHLLPSNRLAQDSDAADNRRAKNLAAFQSKALAHALSFPSVERVVYSTCSVHQTENEDVIKSVLPLAASLNFQLETPFPQWPRRGLPIFEGSEHLLRTDPVEDLEGFFIALFVKKEMRVTNGLPKAFSCSTVYSESLVKHESCQQSKEILQQAKKEGTRLQPKRPRPKNKKRYLMPSRFLRMSQMMYAGPRFAE